MYTQAIKNGLIQEWHIFFNALVFLTRLPAPKGVIFSETFFQSSAKYFPLVGAIVGSCMMGVFLLTNLLFPHQLSLLLAMASTVWLTGAFHEDGWADACDAFGGGYGKSHILKIMKDSRLGTYGVIGLIFIVAIKYETLQIVLNHHVFVFCLGIILAQTLSRFIPVAIIRYAPYVQDIDGSKSKPLSIGIPFTTFLFSFTLTTGIFILCLGVFYSSPSVIELTFLDYLASIVLAIFFSAAGSWSLMRYFYSHIGGYTGDCLGAIQQLSEVLFYLGLVAFLI